MQGRFRRNVEQLAPDDAVVEYLSGDYGAFARITSLTNEQLQEVRESLEETEYGFEQIEPAGGAGFEVWTVRSTESFKCL